MRKIGEHFDFYVILVFFFFLDYLLIDFTEMCAVGGEMFKFSLFMDFIVELLFGVVFQTRKQIIVCYIFLLYSTKNI